MFDRIHTQKCESCANNKQLCCFVCGVGQNGEREYYNPKPKTNGDNFRAMTDEELAEWIVAIIAQETIYSARKVPTPDYAIEMRQRWLEWLKQEAE